MVLQRRFNCPGSWILVLVWGFLGGNSAIADNELIAATVIENKSTQLANQEPVKTIRVGLREDVKPFSYPHENLAGVEILPDYKGFMVEVCRRVLKRMKLDRDYENLRIVSVPVSAKSRFDDLRSGKVDMLCGPDSITTNRLLEYNVTHPMFLSGMTYGYLNSTSSRFPRAEHCGNILGLVNNTTAESSGVEQLSRENVLLRFDRAIDLNLNLDAYRYQKLNEKISKKRLQLQEFHEKVTNYLDSPSGREFLLKLKSGSHSEVENYLRCSYSTENRKRFIDDKVEGYGNDDKVHRDVQAEIARDIITGECPNGFTGGMPIRKYGSHNDGIKAFCAGKVLYYLGDYDILNSKVAEHADCDVIFNRFTTNKEVYVAFFRSTHAAVARSTLETACNVERDTADSSEAESNFETEEQSAKLYADFNRTLLRMMQSDIDILGQVYISEFEGKPMSADLSAFFSSFRVAADLGQPSD